MVIAPKHGRQSECVIALDVAQSRLNMMIMVDQPHVSMTVMQYAISL